MANRKTNTMRLGVVQLESREVPAVLGTPQLLDGVLTVFCDNAPTTILVEQRADGGLQVTDISSGRAFSYAPGQVRRVDLFGGAGNDKFTSRGLGPVRVRMFGRGGNDFLLGGPGRDVIVGGAGNDLIHGRGGDDILLGGVGNDVISGGDGNDILDGDVGDDRLIGGAGTDAISGGNGNDVIIALDGRTTDTADGGNGSDVIWRDQNGALTDALTGIDGFDTVHSVTGFANGADRTLNGDSISDPVLIPGTRYESFRGYPLFGENGPRVQDIAQGLNPITNAPNLDDSWLLAALGSVARTNPDFLRTILADFGDGTFGVVLGGNFYRVDADLPTRFFGSLTPAYAQVRRETGIWVAIFEKAFTYIQSGLSPASYASLNGTGGLFPAGTPSDVFQALGYTPNNIDLSTFPDTFVLAAYLQPLVDNNFPTAIVINTPLIGSNLTPNRAYTLIGYNLNSLSIMQSVVLYNPVGFDGGGSMDIDPTDGFLTVSLTDLLGSTGTIYHGV